MSEMDETRRRAGQAAAANDADKILKAVYQALQERGYDPISQLAGYLLSGDPAFITSHRQARSLIRQVERDTLIEELLRQFVQRVDSSG